MFDLSNAIVSAKKDYIDGLRSARKAVKAKMHRIATNVRAQHLLATEGITLCVSEWAPEMETLTLKKAKDLVRVKRALNCEMKVTGRKTPIGKSRTRVYVYVGVAGFPGLTVRYPTRLPKGSKCQIVTQRYRSSDRRVVCSV